jgi:branched-chain amino acid aminotransferase
MLISYLSPLHQYSQLRVRLAGPHQLQPKPEADDLQFGKLFTDHMFKVAYHKRLGGWQAPEIMPLENLVLHPAAKVLHYAVEVSFCCAHCVKFGAAARQDTL